MNEIEKFDPSTLMQGVKDRIKATFVSLIPDAQWETMVQKEIDTFFNEAQIISMTKKKDPKSDYWAGELYQHTELQQTPFRSLIYELCVDKTVATLKKKLTDEWFTNNWPITEENMTDRMKEVVQEAAPAAMLKFFQSISFMYVNQLRNDIQQYRV